MPDAAAWLQAAYQLTATEARVLLALVAGCSLQEAASRCNVSVNTARWHMKHVTSKMGVSRQSQAVAMAMRQLPTLRA
jgi:LuxR family maltose regulon positive regulatory protein